MAASVIAGPGQKGKHEMLQILSTEIKRIEAKISSDSKLKKMAELQSTVVSDSKNKQAFLDQVLFCFTFSGQKEFVSENKRTNRPFSNSRGWTGSSMKWRLMRANLFKCKLICPH